MLSAMMFFLTVKLHNNLFYYSRTQNARLSFFSYQIRGGIKQRMLDWASLSMRNSTANIFYSIMFLGLFTINQLVVATWGNMIPNPKHCMHPYLIQLFSEG